MANFCLGVFFNENKYISKNIKESTHYYKELSSFNNQNAKNNLGIIYKYRNEV